MLTYFAIAFAMAVAGVLPLLTAKLFLRATAITAIYTLVVGFGFWLSSYGFVGPLGGVGVVAILLVLWIASFLAGFSYDTYEYRVGKMASSRVSFPILGVVVLFGGLILGDGCFRDQDYARLIGPVEDRVWTQDIQPKDARHMRMSTEENAVFMATKVVGTMGAIGSQFELQIESMTLQKVGNDFLYIAPLDFARYGSYKSTSGVPGYVVVDGEDPRHDAKFVEFPAGQELRYTPGAYFGRNLMRHLRLNGYLTTGLTEYTFEIDEEGRPWWVVTTFEPTIIWGGEKVTGALLVDPVTGQITQKSLSDMPSWVDRVVPASFVKSYLEGQGTYANGWYNQFWPWSPHKNLTEPENPNLIYGEGDQPEWVVGITSKGKDDSLISLVYLNSRTGKAVRYEMKGGSTDNSVLVAVQAHPYVRQRQLHGVAPQLYNVLGRPTSVVPIFSDNHAFSGVAMVDIRNVQIMGVGTTQYQAMQEYERVLSEGSGQEGIEQKRQQQVIEGVVDRCGSEVTPSGTSYSFHLVDVPHLFVAGAAQFHKLPVLKEGDTVRIAFDDSAKDVLVVVEFDILNLPLSTSLVQQDLAKRSVKKRTVQAAVEDAATVRERLMRLSPEELQRLGKEIPPSPPQ